MSDILQNPLLSGQYLGLLFAAVGVIIGIAGLFRGDRPMIVTGSKAASAGAVLAALCYLLK